MHLYTKNVETSRSRARAARAGSPRVLTRKLIFFAAVPARRAFFAPRVRTRGKISTSRARGARARLNSNEASFPSGRSFPSSDARARVGRRPSSRASRDARARRTATRARVPRRRRRRRRRRRPTRSSRVVVVVVVVARGVVRRPQSRRARPKPHTPWTVQYLIFTSPVNAGTDCFCFVCRFISTCPTYSSVHTCIIYA